MSDEHSTRSNQSKLTHGERAGDDIFKRLIGLQYRGLITTKDGRDVARALVTAVINQQIAQQTSVRPVIYTFQHISHTPYQVDTISEVLQSRCGSFCSMDDVKYFKVRGVPFVDYSPLFTTFQAQESLRKAMETRNPDERSRCLQESLKFVISVIYAYSLLTAL